MNLVILSDTHGLLRPQVVDYLKTADVILHGGDINRQSVVDELRHYAPLYVVRGNNDKEWAEAIPHDLRVTLGGVRFFMVHNKRNCLPTSRMWTWWCSDTPINICRRRRTVCSGSIPVPAAHAVSTRRSP